MAEAGASAVAAVATGVVVVVSVAEVALVAVVGVLAAIEVAAEEPAAEAVAEAGKGDGSKRLHESLI